MSPLPNRAGRAIAPPTVESLPTTWALQGSEHILTEPERHHLRHYMPMMATFLDFSQL